LREHHANKDTEKILLAFRIQRSAVSLDSERLARAAEIAVGCQFR